MRTVVKGSGSFVTRPPALVTQNTAQPILSSTELTARNTTRTPTA